MSELPPRLAQTVRDAMQAWGEPGCVVAVATRGQPLRIQAFGQDAQGLTLTEDTLFPVSSITKLTVALAMLRVMDQGVLRLDDLLSQHLPDAAAAQPGVTLRNLLAHSSGLPMGYSARLCPYDAELTAERAGRASLETPLLVAPDTKVIYSSVAYQLLALVLERVSGTPLPALLAREVFRPLGVEAYFAEEPPRPVAYVSGLDAIHKGKPIEAHNSTFWRTRGLASSGLVTNPEGLIRIGQAFAGHFAGYLSPALQAEAVRNQTGTLSGGISRWIDWPLCERGLSLDRRAHREGFYIPREAGEDSYGLAGLTNSLTWTSPGREMTWAVQGTMRYQTAAEGWMNRGLLEISRAVLAG